MTTFYHQLKLLLWKNYILRKRHKMRMVLELLWPLILFLILMWVRTRGLRTNLPPCHLIEKSLPSVGGFQFLQNFICTLNNTCFTNYVEDADGNSQWPNAILPKVVQEVTPVLYDLAGTDADKAELTEFFKALDNLTHVLIKFHTREQFRQIGSVRLRSFLDPSRESEFIRNVTVEGLLTSSQIQPFLDAAVHLDKFSKDTYDDVDEVMSNSPCVKRPTDIVLITMDDILFDELCDTGNRTNPDRSRLKEVFKDHLNTEGEFYLKLVRLYEDDHLPTDVSSVITFFFVNHATTLAKFSRLTSAIGRFQPLFEGFMYQGNATPVTGALPTAPDDDEESDTGLGGVTSILYQGICGFTVSENSSLLGDETTNGYDTLRDRLRDYRNRRNYKTDPEVSTVCNTVFKNLELGTISNVIWRQIKPFIRGRLLYYPHTNFTETIMTQVDGKFKELQNLVTTFKHALGFLHRFRVVFDDNLWNYQILQEILRSDAAKEAILKDVNLLIRPRVRAALNDPSAQSFAASNLTEIATVLEQIDLGSELQAEILGCIRFNKSTPYKVNNDTHRFNFASEDDAVRHGLELMLDDELLALVVFLDIPVDGSAPKHLKYKIRMDSDKVDGTRGIRDRITRKTPRRRPSLDLKYITNGFVYVQEMIEHSFIEQFPNANLNDIAMVLQQFPFPCYIFDQFIKAISNTFPLFMILSWVYASAMLIKSIVLEKELRLKEVMKVMGCGNSVIWTAWFLESFVVMSVSCVILSLILKFGKIVEHSDFTVILLFLLIFSITTICFSFFISTFFTKANSAAAAGGILFFVSYLPYNFMLLWEDRLTWYHTLLSCLISNVAFGFGCTYIARFEEDGLGAQWSRISTRTLAGDDFSFSYCVIMLVFDSFLYLGLALYIEAVFPGENGMPRKWYFPVQKSYWFPAAIAAGKSDGLGYTEYTDLSNKPVVEDDPEGLVCGVSVQHLCKKYANGRVALSDLNISFYEDQITSFLGHNGAGKTTTISILTGLFPPSEGTAFIYGYDIRKDTSVIRRDLGICPQHNVLFDRLTVAEHLEFYAGLKGKAEVAKLEMDQMLSDLGIPHKKSEFPKNLSGGMKRKLSVAIAFVGGSRTVFLDEPTSGVDPYSRRSIWELLLKYKIGRTIILTTHFMDEADILGDRIAIISRGQLKACGTSLFLKAQFGQGYFLRLVREIEEEPTEELIQNNVPPSTSDLRHKSSQAISYITKNTEATTRHTALFSSFIKHRIPEVQLISDVGSDVIFLLPSDKVSEFEILFKDLDENMAALRLISYGISDTSLEDVFLHITVEDLEQGATGGEHGGKFRRLWSTVWNKRKSLWKKKKSNQNIHVNVPSDVVVQKQRNSRKVSPELAPRNFQPVQYAPVPGPEEHPPLVPKGRPQLVSGPSLGSGPFSEQSLQKFNSGELGQNHGQPDAGNSAGQWDKRAYSADSAAYQDYEGEYSGEESSEAEMENHEVLLPPTMRRQSSLFGIKRQNIRPKFWVQIWVIILKRFRNSNRNKKAIFFEIVVPALFIALMLATTLILPPPANEDRREVTFTTYPPPNTIFFSEPLRNSPQFTNTVDQLTGQLGLGTPCLRDTYKQGNCRGGWSFAAVQEFLRQGQSASTASLGTCECSSGSQMCQAQIERPEPPKLTTRTKDTLLDVSKYRMSDWILKTYFKYDPNRIGGFEMTKRPPEDYTVSEFVTLLEQFISHAELDSPQAPLDLIIPPNRSERGEKSFYKIWFDNRAWLSSIAYLNGLNNMLLRQKLEGNGNGTVPWQELDQYGITLYTHPMNLTQEQQRKESIKTAALGVIHAICVIFALSFVPASFTVYLIEERRSGAKHLHLISGVRPITYWVSNLSFDMVKYLFSAALCLILFFIFDARAYIGKDSVAGFITLLILYGWAAIPLMYPASYVFSIPSTAFVALACMNLFIGIITTVSTFVLDQLGDEELKEISEILQQVFLIFPHYCLGRGLIELVKLHVAATAFQRLDIDVQVDRFEWDILGKLLVCLAIQGFCFFLFSILAEYKQWIYLLCCKTRIVDKERRILQSRLSINEEDDDVHKEVMRVSVINNPPKHASLLAQNLGKIYSGKKRPAVNNICFAVNPGECFGLLGVNGAGKSTTFKMLTGDVRITSGKAYIMNWDVEKNLDQARKHYGYCPQEDGIDPLLNSYEQLELYGRLRGLTLQEVRRTAAQLIQSLGLTRYATKRCGTYSGGNKRKLSTAVALIGNPDVLFLDEPTSGMDPGARRQLWKLITAVTRMGKSVVLTSHSMEECEALCSRLAIMVNGRFMCLGSLQHLKNRFGKGYRLTVRCPVPQQEDFLRNLEMSLPFAKLEDAHCTQLKFNIPQEDVKLSYIFSVMCIARTEGIIEDFSVSQTTLDDIFIKFASEQRDELDGKHEAIVPIA